MRIVIAGAGAVGGYIGARLARAGADVVLFARGPHLQAMQSRGLRVTSVDGDFEVRPHVTGDLASIGTVDVVFLGVKAHGLTALAPALRPLFGPDTVVVSTQNGVPWWYFQNYGGELDGLHLERVDPGGVIASSIEPRRVVGSLAYFATDIAEPGVIHHTEGNRISFGEPDGSKSERAKAIAEALIAAGFRCPVTARFRHEIWVKLLGNVAFNPISALTGGTLEELARHPDTSKVIREIMTETEAVAAKLGLEMPISIDQRMAGAEKVGAHKTSMLQDLEAGRPLELEAVVGAVVELGERLGVPMPSTCAVYACAKMMIANLQYAWTLFVNPLQAGTGWKLSDIQVAFTLFILCQTWVQPLDGWLIDRLGPRGFITAAGVLCGLGWAGMGYATSLPMLYVLYCLAGTGEAFVYSGSIGSALKWFKEKRGLASGIMAAGFGGGTALFIPVIQSMLRDSGYQHTFLVTGIFQGVVIAIVAQFLRHPAAEAPAAGQASSKATAPVKKQYTTMEVLRTPQFYVMYIAFILMATGGLLVTANAGPMAKSWGFSITLAATLGPLANGAARIFWGWASDRFGRENTMILTFVLQACCLVAVATNQPGESCPSVATLVAVYFTW